VDLRLKYERMLEDGSEDIRDEIIRKMIRGEDLSDEQRIYGRDEVPFFGSGLALEFGHSSLESVGGSENPTLKVRQGKSFECKWLQPCRSSHCCLWEVLDQYNSPYSYCGCLRLACQAVCDPTCSHMYLIYPHHLQSQSGFGTQ
jgi:hypothetical protein